MSSLSLSGLELKSLFNSLIISSSVAVITSLLGLFLALGFFYFRFPGKKILRWLLLIPLLIPPYLQAFSLMHLMLFLGDLKLFGLNPSLGINMVSSLVGVIEILSVANFPIAFLLILNALKNIPDRLIDSALQNSDPFKVVKLIVIPQLFPALLSSGLLVFILTFMTFDVPAFLGLNVFALQIFRSFSFANDISKAMFLSIIPVVITGTLGAILFRLIFKNRSLFNLSGGSNEKTSRFRSSPVLTGMFSSLVYLLVIVTVFLPIAVLQLKNILADKVPYNIGFSSETLVNTLLIALVASSFIVTTTFVIFYKLKKNSSFRLFFLLTFVFPPVTFAILFIYLFNRAEFNFIYSTPAILLFAYFFRFAPVAYELFYSRYQSLNPQLLTASALVPASFFKQLLTIFLPLFLPTIFISWLLTFWLIATELPITLLIQPPGFQTIITRLFIVLHYGAVELMSQMTTSLILLSLLPVLAIYLFLKLNRNG